MKRQFQFLLYRFAAVVVSKMEIVQQEGARHAKRNVDFYNLDAIISVGKGGDADE